MHRIRTRSFRSGSVLVVVAVGIVAVIAIVTVSIMAAGRLSAPPPKQQRTVKQGSWTTAPPGTIDGSNSPLTVSYTIQHVVQQRPASAGGSFPWSNFSSRGESGAQVEFVLANGHAAFAAGGSRRTVRTDSNGLAKVELTPGTAGTDTLSVRWRHDPGAFSSWPSWTSDPVTHSFEVAP